MNRFRSSAIKALIGTSYLLVSSFAFQNVPLPVARRKGWSTKCSKMNKNTLNQPTTQKDLRRKQCSNLQLHDNLLGIGITSSIVESSSDIASTLLTSTIETFDGSLVDPVVVSGAFWVGLQSKIISLIIGQFLAAGTFAVVSSFISANAMKMVENVMTTKLSFLNEKKKDVQDMKSQRQQKSREKPNTVNPPTVAPDFGKLIFCLILDTLGTSSEFIPIVGELTDVVYAPFAAIALRSLFQGSNIVFALEFIEEILPFTDILPLATICWVVETYYASSDLARLLQIGDFGLQIPSVNDVQSKDEVYTNEQAYMQSKPRGTSRIMKDDDFIDVPYTKDDDKKLPK